MARDEKSAYRFEDKVVLVTGGARGMGEAHIRGFHAEGAKVVIADLLEGEGQKVAAELGERAIFIAMDVTNSDDWDSAVAVTEKTFGPLSVLVNNAAINTKPFNIEDHDIALWRHVIDVNLTSQFLGIRATVPSIRRAGGGAIVNISSVGGIRAVHGKSAYCAAKFGVRGLTQSAALELGRYNIRVNTVVPGATDTPMSRGTNTSNFAIARRAQPSEISRMVLYLASEEASFSSGSTFDVDGGYLLGEALR